VKALSRLSCLLVVVLVFQQLMIPVKGVFASVGVNDMQDSIVSEPINIPDANLKNAINYLLNRPPEAAIYEADLKGFRKLSLSGKNIESIEGLQYAANLEELDLNWNKIKDLSPVANLTNLTKLYFDSNQVSDLTPLQNLTSLVDLGAGGNLFTSIVPIARLTKLSYLNLSDHHLTDISPLSNLTNVTRLYLYGGLNQTNLTDIRPLASLVNLRELYLSYNRIKDISPLANLPVLSGLYLDHNQIEDITPLAKLPLGTLNLSGNQISDISTLRNHTGMVYLYLHSNKIEDISALLNMNRLYELDLGDNRIRDIEPIKYALPKLTLLDLSSNLLTDISLIDNSGYYIKNLNVYYNFIPTRSYQYRFTIPSHYQELEVLGKGPIVIPVELSVDKRYLRDPAYSKEKGSIFSVESKNDRVKAILDENGNLVVTGLSEGEAEVTLAFPNPDLNQTVHIAQVDLTAPAVPIVDEVTDQTDYITGTSEQYAKISLKIGNWNQVVDTYNEGYFYSRIPRYPVGTKIEVTATDRAGNVSVPAVLEVKDATAPVFTELDDLTDQSTSVKGVVEPGAVIKVMVDDSLLGSAIAGADGQFEIPIPKQQAGTIVKVIAVDLAGNENIVTFDVRDVTPPSKPIVHELTDRDTVITGKVDAGVTTVYLMKNGVIYWFGNVDAEGNFTASIPVQKAGTEIQVQAVENAGNASEITVIVVKDATPPAAPIVYEVNDQATSVTGRSETGAKIQVKVNGTVIGEETAGENGQFTVKIPVQKAGTQLVVEAVDQAGNVSEPASVVVKDITAPALPEVNGVTNQDTFVTGVAEAGSRVEVKVYGSTIGEGKAGADGKFSVAIPAQKTGTELFITVIDQSGNANEAAKVVVSAKLKGWVPANGVWYYYDVDTGEKKVGWLNDGSTWYYLGADGAMKTGWLRDGATWYYLKGSGAMATGWVQVGGVWYYFQGSGAMVTGWLQSGETWYYFHGSGAMATGWVQNGGIWYYFQGSGAMQIGWLYSSGQWYYFKNSGAMQTSWAYISGKWYYFDSNGVLK
jgi:Leucine-rich repeat (LRR) protein